MKTLTLLFSLFLMCPLSVWGQSADELLSKVSDALSEGKDDYAVSLFRQAANAGEDRTEMFYWTNVDKSSEVAPRLADVLAVHYKEMRNYDKAYLFYKEFLQRHPEDVPALVSCAEMEMMRGKEKDALKTYEKVLMLDADNLQANIFLGNYYYLQAEKDKKKLEEDYKKITSPQGCSMHAIATDCQTCSPIATARLRHTCNACFRYSPPWKQAIRWKR